MRLNKEERYQLKLNRLTKAVSCRHKTRARYNYYPNNSLCRHDFYVVAEN